MQLILGIDPGVTTGAAFVVANEDRIRLSVCAEIKGGVKGVQEWWKREVDTPCPPQRIIMEDFISREGKHGVDHTPERVIGAVWALADTLNIPVKMRAPSGRIKQAPDWVLKELGLHLPGRSNRNAREAIRHVVSQLKTEQHPVIMEVYRHG